MSDNNPFAQFREQEQGNPFAQFQQDHTRMKSTGVLTDPVPEQHPRGRFTRERAAIALMRRPDAREFEPESLEGRRASAADRGIDFRTGSPFSKRIQLAVAPGFKSAQIDAAKMAFKDEILAAADSGEEFLRYDEDLGDLVFRRTITQEDIDQGLEKPASLGKTRWTALNAPGFQPGDLASLFDLPELGSIVGSVATLGRGKAANLLGFKKAVGKQAAGGLAGRELGNLIEIVAHYGRGGELPTRDELINMGMTDVGIELLGSILGEAGSRYVIDPLVRQTQKTAARAGFGGAPDAKAVEAADIAADINATAQKGEFAPSVGEAVDDPATLVMERSRIKNASPARRQHEAERVQNERRAFREYIDAKFAGDPVVASRADIIKDANSTIKSGQRILIAETEVAGHKSIHVFPGNEAATGKGLEIKSRGGTTWQIVNSDLTETGLINSGFGKEMYKAAAEAARDRGARLTSDTSLSPDAVRVWQSIDGSPEVGKLKWNIDPRVPDNWEGGQLVSDGIRPVVEVTHPVEEATTRKLLAEANQTFQGEGGRITSRWNDFMNNPNPVVKGQIRRDTEGNSYLKADVLEQVWKHYEKNVFKKEGGQKNFSHKAHTEWMNKHEDVLSAILTPDELSRMRVPGAFRKLRESLAESNESARRVTAHVLRQSKNTPLLKDNQALVSNISKMPSRERQRTLQVLKRANPEQYTALENIVKEDITHTLKGMFSGGATTSRSDRFNKWLSGNNDWLTDVFGRQYTKDLTTLGKGLEIASRRSGVTGAAEEATPGVLGLFRAVFGPLSRKQRFITAGRRTQVRAMGERAIDVVTDPAVLRSLVEIREAPIPSRQAMAVLARVGVLDALGTEDPQEVLEWAKWAIQEARLDENVE